MSIRRGFKRLIWKDETELASQFRLGWFLYGLVLLGTLFLVLGYQNVI